MQAHTWFYHCFPILSSGYKCINSSILVLSGCEIDCLYVGYSINPSGPWAAGEQTCIPLACHRTIELGDSTTCCFIYSTLQNKSLQMNTTIWFRLSLKVGRQAMQTSFVAVGLQSVQGHSLAVGHSVLICLEAPLNQPGKYFHCLDLVLAIWGFKTIL